MFRKILLILSIVLFFYVSGASAANKTLLKNGDIIFHSSNSSQSQAIQLATDSPYNHCGIIFIEGNKYFVLEAVQPVRLSRVDEWIKRGNASGFVVKRLKNADKLLTPKIITKMKKISQSYIGKNYDPYFEWSDNRIYCSELIWKIYKQALNLELGKPQKFKTFDLSHPVVKAKLKERFGEDLPLEETVISPAGIYHSKLLKTVYSKKEIKK